MELSLGATMLADEAAVSLDAVLPHRKAVIAHAADLLATQAGMSYEDARNALAAREALGATAIGHGVALPHAISSTCLRPAVALIRLVEPVPFGAADRMATDIVLAMLWPSKEATAFQRAAREACRFLRDPKALNAIRRAASASELNHMLERLDLLAAER